MKPVFFSDAFKTGIAEIDRQHQVLFGCYNDLIAAFENPNLEKRKIVIESTLSELISYTKYHFYSEEMALEMAGYSQLEEHKREHSFLREQLVDFHSRYIIHSAPIQEDLLKFIERWIVNHIQKSDMAYVPQVISKMPK